MTWVAITTVRAGDVDVGAAQGQARLVRRALDRDLDEDPVLFGRGGGPGDVLAIPRPVAITFLRILDLLAAGQGVQIVPHTAELTTQQAADMLNVSRHYLLGLLESKRIPYRRLGRHRMIAFEDFLDYRRHDDVRRRAAADELAELSQGLDRF